MTYTIEKQIGDPGGFGSVHICTSELGDKYAIKLLENLNNDSTERFKKEIRLTSRLSHPNIIKIIAYGADSKRKFYIMPLYFSSLKPIIPDLYGNYERQYSVISEIINGMVYLHSEGVLHRDLKPQNILYNSDSDIVINDLGLSRQVNSGSARLTCVGEGFGTYRYTAPEQFIDASSADERSDIFSIGKILEDIVTRMLENTIPTLELEYIISKCTETDPNKRFANVLELKSAVDSVYQNLLGIVNSSAIEDLLMKVKLGNIDGGEVCKLALLLLEDNNGDRIEEFFYSLSDSCYEGLEKQDRSLLERLIILLQQHLTGQGWGFGYTDIIGRNCNRMYNHSKSAIVRANLLYTLIEVGISHNRFYVMGIASQLIKKAKNNIPESLELAQLLSMRSFYINKLNIVKDDLPICLKPYFRKEKTVI